MTDETQKKRGLVTRGLTLVALVLVAVMYFQPTWWVALEAPQYPPEAFPDGVRIDFHINGVFNGCQPLQSTEVYEVETLDCVHEMDAINHFVGMYPIAAGGVIERGLSQFLFSMLGVMLVGFLIFKAKVRAAVLSVGFVAISVWMYMSFYGANGLALQNAGYLNALVVSLGHGNEEEGEELSPIVAKLKESLAESGESSLVSREEVNATLDRSGQTELKDILAKLHQGNEAAKPKSLKEILEEAKSSGKTGKEADMEVLRASFEADQSRKPVAQREAWIGSTQQVMFWHYEKSLGRWFNNQAEIVPLVELMTTIGTFVVWATMAAMAVVVVITLKNGGLLYWVLPGVPALLPVFFLMEYAGWLWWYGHSLNDMGAFTLKPFMPTVFGQGKVAQFVTLSYPSTGFFLMLGVTVCMLLAMLLRRKHIIEGE
ncbi:hypothetical protein RYZ26_15755 [Terasakiella sp. A23]|uniref:hypothetical protein n=1 Tax=Terasakiella sp. FCG-A23 TaxID=3080561 RepID=UPI0029535041|nr:hypothetical protein [Terasakiella sp. A23]MDV7341062.1 hypothetical protein [Terasakiella sp. A23]